MTSEHSHLSKGYDFYLPHLHLLEGLTLQNYTEEWRPQSVALDPKYGRFQLYSEYEEHEWPLTGCYDLENYEENPLMMDLKQKTEQLWDQALLHNKQNEKWFEARKKTEGLSEYIKQELTWRNEAFDEDTEHY